MTPNDTTVFITFYTIMLIKNLKKLFILFHNLLVQLSTSKLEIRISNLMHQFTMIILFLKKKKQFHCK
jgi:hypothetical protein